MNTRKMASSAGSGITRRAVLAAGATLAGSVVTGAQAAPLAEEPSGENPLVAIGFGNMQAAIQAGSVVQGWVLDKIAPITATLKDLLDGKVSAYLSFHTQDGLAKTVVVDFLHAKMFLRAIAGRAKERTGTPISAVVALYNLNQTLPIAIYDTVKNSFVATTDNLLLNGGITFSWLSGLSAGKAPALSDPATPVLTLDISKLLGSVTESFAAPPNYDFPTFPSYRIPIHDILTKEAYQDIAVTSDGSNVYHTSLDIKKLLGSSTFMRMRNRPKGPQANINVSYSDVMTVIQVAEWVLTAKDGKLVDQKQKHLGIRGTVSLGLSVSF